MTGRRKIGQYEPFDLVLLLILTVLATAGMQAATVELQLAGGIAAGRWLMRGNMPTPTRPRNAWDC